MTNNNNYDNTIDVSWHSAEEERPGQVPPEIGEQEFEIVSGSMTVQSQGEYVNEKCANLRCVQISGEFPGTRSTNKFLGFGPQKGKRGTSQLGETKGFMADIGRSDIFDHNEFNPEMVVGTTFIADVAHSINKKTGKLSVWLNQPRKSVQYAENVQTYANDVLTASIDNSVNADLPAPVSAPVPAAQAARVAPSAPAPAVEPRPAIPRRMRPTQQG
jgi:hypothetical protein